MSGKNENNDQGKAITKKHILILTDNLDCGGAQDLVYNYIKYGDSKRFRFTVSNLSKAGVYSDRIRELGAEVIDFNGSQYNVFVFFRLMAYIRTNPDIDIIHSQFGKSHLFAPILGKIYKKKVIVHNHSGISNEHLLPYLKFKLVVILYRAILLRLFAWVDCGIAINQENRNDFVKFKPTLDKVFVTLYNGIELDRFILALQKKEKLRTEIRTELKISPDDYIIINIARLSQEKGQGYLIEAMESLLAEEKNVKLVIVGKGLEKNKLLEMSQNLSLTKSIHFLGERDDVPSLLAASDLFVLPSLKEPFGLVLLEAMMMKIPVVATDAGGPIEFIDHGVNGFKVKAKNVQALVNQIIELKSKPVQYQSVVQSAFNMVQRKFNIINIVSELEDIYDRL